MGIAAAFIFPASLAILTSIFNDPSERQKALGIWGATSGIAVAFGPITGGALLEHFWYGSIFLVNVPIVIVTLIAGQLLIPRLPRIAAHPFDWPGRRASRRSGVTALVLAIIEGPQWGWASPGTLACFAAAAVLLVVFARPRAAHRGPAPRRAGLRHPTLQRGRGLHLGRLLLPLRLHLPDHPVLPVRQGLLDAVGRACTRCPSPIVAAIATPVAAVVALRVGSRLVVTTGLLAHGSRTARRPPSTRRPTRATSARSSSRHGAVRPRAVLDHRPDGGSGHGLGGRRPARRAPPA